MQQPGVNNMQLWQQLLMYKRIQEHQRQQQFKQLDQGTRQQIALSQLSAAAKPAPADQIPAMINEVPINHSSDVMWPNTFDPSMPLAINSQTFIADNMNWAKLNDSPAMPNIASGFVISNDQIQAMQSLGFIPQQLDQTFHGMPVSSTKGSIDQHPQFLGTSSDCTDLTITGARNEVVKTFDPFNYFQNDHSFPAQNLSQERTFAMWNFHGKGSLDDSCMQTVTNHVTSGNFQQADHLKDSILLQELQDRQDKADWSSNLQENPTVQVETSHDVAASLDPTEQKLLFGIDDDHCLRVAIGGSFTSCSGNSLSGSSLENGYFGAIPSMQSGSWSALMQEAVQACSSDKGLHEEWSGLIFQKMEQSVVKDSVVSNDNTKQPTTWDDSYLQSACSNSGPLPLYNDADACSNSCTSPSFHNSFGHDGNSRVQNGAPHVFLQLSAGENNHKQFHQVQKQKQFFEGGPQARVPLADGLRVDQSYKQCANNSADMQYVEGSWTCQQNVALVNFPGESSNDWNNSYTLAPGRDCISDVCDNDGNMGKFGGSNMNVNGGEQPVESDIGSSVQAEDFVVDNYGSVVNANNFELNEEMNQQITNSGQIVFGKSFTLHACINSRGDESVGRNKNQPSRRPQTWDNKRLSGTHENQKHLQMVSGEGYTSNSLNPNQYSNSVSGAKENSALSANDPSSFASGSQKSKIQTGQQIVGSKMMQSPIRSLGMNVEPLFPTNQPLFLQRMPKSVFQGSKNEEQIYVGKSKFADHVDSNNAVDVAKRIAVEAQQLKSRDIIPIHASSSSFDESIGQYFRNKGIAQTSQNMLELLHKVDQSRNNATDMPTQAAFHTTSRFGQPSAVQGFGLQLAPPSQQLSNFAFASNTSLNDIKSRQLDQQVDKDQTWSSSVPSVRSLPSYETSQREIWGNISGLPGQKHKETLESGKQYNSSSALASNFVGNQLQGQHAQQHIPSAKIYMEQQQQQQQLQQLIPSSTGYGTSDQSMNFIINQANVNALDKNASLLQQPYKSNDGALANQSIQTSSIPTLAGRVPPSRVASSGDTLVLVGSKLQPAAMDNTKQMITDFSQIRSSMYSVTETMSGLQTSIAGMSQQVDPSTMLGCMWTNISARQRQSGLHSDNLILQIPQSNNVRETVFRGLQKTNDQGSKGESDYSGICTNPACLQNGKEDSNKGASLKPTISEKMDATTKAETELQGHELTGNALSEGAFNASISSLVRLHQQGMDEGKSGQDSAFCSQAVHGSITRIASSSSGIGFSGCTSNPSDVQQKNHSLLYQIHAMGEADSDPRKKLHCRLKGADCGSNSSHVYWKKDPSYVYGQDADFRIPADSELGENSQGSLSSDAKMLSFASKENVKKNASTLSSPGRHELQHHISSLSTSSATNLIKGNEHTHKNPLMAPSWFVKSGTYKNDAAIAEYDGHKSTKVASQHKFSLKVPGSTDNNIVVEQSIEINQDCTHGQSVLTAEVASNGTSTHSQLPAVTDRSVVLNSRKRKSATTELVPWHKVTQRSQRLRSISISELDWAQAANKLMEKVHDVAEAMENGSSTTQPRRRLILTTQLMQQLIPPVPSRMLNTEVISAHENATFFVAKSTLADAFSLISSLERDSCVHMFSENVRSYKKAGDHVCSKIMEVFVRRFKKLLSDFSRLDKRTSVLDVLMECQELERFYIMNRLGKFHGRPHKTEESLSTLEVAPCKTLGQSYITALPLPGNLPEGVPCLSL